MSDVDLRSLEGLRKACSEATATVSENADYVAWSKSLQEFLEYVESADQKTRSTEDFQRRLWEDNPVSAVGMGTVNIDDAIGSEDFRSWLAEKSLVALPDSWEARASALDKLFEEIRLEISKYSNRNPRLKIYRAMAALFPRDFTTIAYLKSLLKLRMGMLGRKKDRGPRRHMNVLRRLDEALGPAGNDLKNVVDRMRLPWLLYAQFIAPEDETSTETIETITGTEKLRPLPAARRRRGLSGFVNGLDGILNVLEFCRDGVPREELRNHIKSLNPNLKESSISINTNVLIGELNVLRWEDNLFVLTERGETLLESGDPNDLMDWLVTHILGIDHVLVILRKEGPTRNAELVPIIQGVNPGWTSNWAPALLVNTLRTFGMVERDDDGVVSLTEDGRIWADQIDWELEILERSDDQTVIAETEATQDAQSGGPVSLPAISTIFEQISAVGHFPESLVERLHAGVWAHNRRHFAILTGLSGSGKTLLARAYGSSLLSTTANNPKEVRVIAVQPGWYDPTALLGYVNPLQGDSYVRTPFLEFLINANANPSKPYTVILDEMNLSRPEQYFAPVLSAMETGLPIALHRESELLDGVPPSIQYPKNLAIIGTVNMDETTHGLSDKVLDRAFTVEFWKIDLDKYPGWGNPERSLSKEQENAARQLLIDLMSCLEPARLHFGWRTVDDVLDYLAALNTSGSKTSVQSALDSVIYAKVLPKFRGDDSQRFRDALKGCIKVFGEHALDDCRDKTKELLQDLELTGSARFWR